MSRTFPIAIYHLEHAPVMPRSCGSLEEYQQLAAQGWYTEGEAPSPIPDHQLRQSQSSDANAPTDPPRDADGLRTDGPTLETYLAAGYTAEGYPPQDYAAVDSEGLRNFREAQRVAAEDAVLKAAQQEEAERKKNEQAQQEADAKKASEPATKDPKEKGKGK